MELIKEAAPKNIDITTRCAYSGDQVSESRVKTYGVAWSAASP
jgi:hypothetical protein